MVDEFEVRLQNPDVPDGEVRLGDLAALAGSLQELSLRVGRYVVERSGPGRTPAAIESLAELRLRSISAGSARLAIVRGSADELDLVTPERREAEAGFWDVIAGIGANERPSWTTDLIAESARQLVDAMQHAAAEVTFVRARAPDMRLRTAETRREPWQPHPPAPREEVAISGVLRAVDVDSRRFRVRDDVGNRIPLEDVDEAARTAPLINMRVTATGLALRGDDGVLRAVSHPVIAPELLPESWLAGRALDWTAELAKPGPDADGGTDLSDDEFDAFMSAMGR